MLPIFQTDNKDLHLMQTKWASEINPVLAKPNIQGNLLTGIHLINGTTVVNHLLGRRMQGWQIVDINAAATIYRSQPFDELTLSLVSNAAVTVNLLVF